ncbi:WD40 repeat-like protein [Cyathus striatus]|nr:WD40 repeat-like protein [Cyathus striatus]
MKPVEKKEKGKAKESHNLHPRWNPQSEWNSKSLTDPSSSKIPPIYTKDGSYFFSLVASSVKVHSVATGKVVSTLSVPPLPHSSGKKPSSSILTSAALSPLNPYQLITGCLDGRLIIWDIVDGILLRTVDVGQPILHLCVHEKFPDNVFLAVSRSKNGVEGHSALVMRISLKILETTKFGIGEKPQEVMAVGKMNLPTGLAISPNGEWMVATASHKVYVARTASLSSGFTKYVSQEALTCLAFHPSEEYFATGDAKGFVRLWYCLNDDLAETAHGVEKKTQTSSMHWHAHAVSSIAFTPNGSYLLSGGEEAVLVIWQLHSGNREFVPRVGAPISTVSVCCSGDRDEEYLLGLADASYVFINTATLRITRSYSRVKVDPAAQTEVLSAKSSPLAAHPLSSTLILPSSHPSSLQIFSPASLTLVSELEVSPSNRVSRREDKPIEAALIEKSVVSQCGQWMATIDSREGEDGVHGEVYLKIWRWDSPSKTWILNTRIDRPHGIQKILDIAFGPLNGQHSPYLATAGKDGYVRIWRVRTRNVEQNIKEDFWVLRSVFNFRSEIPRSISWSPDGSLLAIALGPTTVLYDPIMSTLRLSLSSAECRDTKTVHFIGSAGRFLLSVGKRILVLWDLLSQTVRWHCSIPTVIEHVIPHPCLETFCVFLSAGNEDKTLICSFGHETSTPSGVHSVPFLLNTVIFNSLTPSDTNNFVGITREWTVTVFGEHITIPSEVSAIGVGPSIPTQKRTLFQDIFGKSAFSDLSNVPITYSQRSRKIEPGKTNIFDIPSYLAPSLDAFFNPFIDAFLQPRPSEVAAQQAEVEEEDVDMEDTAEPFVLDVPERRVVNEEEMAYFTELFRKHSVNVPAPVLTNGKSNGLTKTASNGTAKSSNHSYHSPSKQNSVSLRSKETADSAVVPPASSTSPASMPLGRKRKKSMG